MLGKLETQDQKHPFSTEPWLLSYSPSHYIGQWPRAMGIAPTGKYWSLVLEQKLPQNSEIFLASITQLKMNECPLKTNQVSEKKLP